MSQALDPARSQRSDESMYMSSAYSIFLSEATVRAECCVIEPNSGDLPIAEFAVRIGISEMVGHYFAPFCNHVSLVVKASAEEEMGRIATNPIVAFVQNPKTIWDTPERKLPADAMSADSGTPEEVESSIPNEHL